MGVRAKFTVQEHRVTQYGSNDFRHTTVILRPQYDSSIPEDQRYAMEISMQVDNPAALDQLGLGRAFYVDFTPVEG